MASAKTSRLWDLRTGREIANSEEIDARNLVFEGTDTRLLAGGSAMNGLRRFVIQRQGGEEGGRLEIVEDFCLLEAQVNHFALSPDGRTVAVTFRDRSQVSLLDALTGEPRGVLDGRAGVSRLQFDPSGRWLAAGCWKGAGVRIWDRHHPNAAPVDLFSESHWSYAAFAPNGKWMVTGSRDGYRIWTAGKWGAPEAVLPTASVSQTAFDASGEYMACQISGGTIGLVHLNSLEVVAELRPPIPDPFDIGNLAISPDGVYLAATTAGTEVFVWNLVLMRRELAGMGLDWE